LPAASGWQLAKGGDLLLEDGNYSREKQKMKDSFTSEQLQRYSRHILLKEVGEEGQRKLLEGRVLIIGAGGLGSPAALYLAAAGVGTIGIVDSDTVDISNLHRQVIHNSKDIGRAKVVSAREKMEGINPDVRVVSRQTRIDASNILPLIGKYDFVIDATDNFSAKFLINDACVLAGKAFSHAGVLGFSGQTMTVKPGESTCYRCIFTNPPPAGSVPSCAEVGVLGVLPGIIGAIQAAEAIKFLSGVGDLLTGRLLMFDAQEMFFRNVPIGKNPHCPICGNNPTIKELRDDIC
jgi:molybdopterin/thiamine biosynthesis adenylyltransferase